MKKMIRIYRKAAFCLILFAITTTTFGQIIPCDTCTYDYDHNWHPRQLDDVVKYNPQNQGEFSPCETGTIQKKNIVFIHGLGGSANSWAKPAVWTSDNYQTGKTVVNYDAKLQTSFNYIADNLLEPQIRAGSNQVSANHPGRCTYDDFAIAHSQGGIAARYLDWKWDTDNSGDFGSRSFYGLVTFATPHAGADIAMTKTEHARFVTDVVSSIFLTKVDAFIFGFSQSFIGRFMGVKGQDFIDKIDETIEDKMAPIMLASVHAPTLDEMHPYSNTMVNLNYNHVSRLRKVAFYGVENAPECWKVISGFTDTAASDYPLWGAIRDNQFQEKMEEARAIHEGELVDLQRKLRKRRHMLSSIWVSHAKTAEIKAEQKRRRKAVNFLNNANTQWRYLIGSLHRDSFETKTINVYIVKWDEKYGWLSKWFHQERKFYDLDKAVSFSKTIHGQVYQIKNKSIATVHETKKVQKLFPSDGVVLKRSQIAFPGVGNRTDKMEGDNHFQERNSPETHRVMKKLYEGGYDKYFKTKRKL